MILIYKTILLSITIFLTFVFLNKEIFSYFLFLKRGIIENEKAQVILLFIISILWSIIIIYYKHS